MEKEVTVKSSLIEVNDLIKAVLSNKSELTPRGFAEQVGENIWFVAELLGIELD